MTEKDLIEAVKQGDRTAFEQVFRAYYPDLCRIAFQYLKDKDDAQEVVQDLFVKIWSKHLELNIVSSLKKYLYRATINQSINFLNHQRAHRKHITYVDIDTLEDVSESPKVDTTELEKKVYLAISEMPEKRRRIFELSRFEKLKYHEIAQKLEISIKTVETQMSRALRHLRNKVNKHI